MRGLVIGILIFCLQMTSVVAQNESDSVMQVANIDQLIAFGDLYKDANNIDKARQFYQIALENATDLRERWLATDRIATAFALINRKQAAYETYDKFLFNPTTLADTAVIAYCYQGIGRVCYLCGDYVKSMRNYEQAEKYLSVINDEIFSIQLTCNKAITLIAGGDVQRAEQLLVMVNARLQKIGSEDSFLELYEAFAKLYEKTHNYEKAFHYSKLYNEKSNELIYERLTSAIDDYDNLPNPIAFSTSTIEEMQSQLSDYKRRYRSIGLQSYIALSFAIFMIGLASALYVYKNRYKRKIKRLYAEMSDRAQISAMIANDITRHFEKIINISNLQIQYAVNQGDTELANYYRDIYTNTLRAHQAMLNQLYWNQMADQLRTNITSVDLTVAVEQILEVCRIYAENKGINLSANMPEDTIVMADEANVNAILHNIIINAIKYTTKGGRVMLTCEVQVERTIICIEDTGIGMTPETLEKILRDTFVTGTLGTKNERGFGIGLLVCRNLVSINHGEMKIESERGMGTKVTITLPNKTKKDRRFFL